MRFLSRALLASAFLACGPALALEIDCVPDSANPAALTAMQRSEGVTLDEDLKEKRRKARAEELARAQARFMQQTRAVASPAEPVPAILVPAQ
jgi:hypothetical protein